MLVEIIISTLLILLLIQLERILRKMPTQQEVHDQLKTATTELKDAINAAAARVANAIAAAGGEQVVPLDDVLEDLSTAKSTVDAIAPESTT